MNGITEEPTGLESAVVSVVVPTRCRPALLDRCLLALLDQSFPLQKFEVIVVDDGPDPETEAVVSSRAAGAIDVGLRLRYLALESAGPAAARNRGWREATGAIVAFTDDDCLPQPGWLAAGAAAFDRGDVAAVSGKIVVPLNGTPTDYQLNVSKLEEGEFVTANCFYRRSVLADLGGFDERFRVAWREDTDLLFAALEKGLRLEPADDAVVVHPVRPASWGISLRQQSKTQYNALLYKKHPKLYRRRIQRAPNWRYYAATMAAILALVSVVVGWSWMVAVTAAMVWLILTILFSMSRLRQTSRAPLHVLEMAVTSALIPPLAIFWRLRGDIRYRARLL